MSGGGDYGANTGPVHLLSLDLTDPGAGLTDEATLTTEQIQRLVPSTSGLLCPFLDPQGGIGNPENGSYALRQSDGTWDVHSIGSPYAVHVFDMAETAEGLWAIGSAQVGDPATATYGQVWAGSGDTWTSSLQIEALADDWTRFTAAVVLGGELLVFMIRIDDSTRRAWHRTGGAWVEIDGGSSDIGLALPFAEGGVPFAFCLGVGTIRTLPADVASEATIQAGFDALALTPVTACVSSSGSHLYVLGYDGRLVLHDGTGWSTVTTISLGNAVCLAVDDTRNRVWFGTSDSKLTYLDLA